ncbi:MAG: neocarzinostatin apoprotein domain-containing protein [Mycobacteriales bacterium]
MSNQSSSVRGPSRRYAIGALACLAALLLAGCSSSHGSGAPGPVSSLVSGSRTPYHPTMTVTPATGLHSREVVQIAASGFPPHDSLGITECADKGAATGEADCNIAALVPVTADGSGNVSGTYTVTVGPFGANHIVCSATQKCLLSVSELTLSNPLNASEDISFAG